MRKIFPATMSAMLLTAGACTSPGNPMAGASAAGTPSQATVQSHVDAAKAAAGTDLLPLMVLCEPPPATRPPKEDTEAGLAKAIALPAPPPGKAFDNLYFIGATWVSAWALKTSDGIILIDALDNRAEGAALIEGGLVKLGLDPRTIKYVIVTHGHGDHYGDAAYLARTYGARIVMSAQDWKMTSTRLEFDSKWWDPPPVRDPNRDLSVSDGDKITLGDTTVTLYITPGHTMGTITPVFDAKSGGQTHRVMEWGGTAFNFGADLPRLDSYIAATERMRGVVRQQNIDTLISNHPNYDGSIRKLERERAQPGGPNPFVQGTPVVDRALSTMGECARATKDRFSLKS